MLGEWVMPVRRVFYFLSPFANENDLKSPEALIIRQIRLPRILSAFLTGGILSASGIILQGLLSNPMAEPYTLGIASGAAFGASIGILSGVYFVVPSALFGALGALFIVKLISSKKIILAGIITNAFLSSGVTFIKAIAGEKLYAVVLWLMGSFAGADFNDVYRVLTGAFLIFIPGIIYAPYIDVMSLGDERGLILGINESRVRNILLFTASAGVALSVSSFGIIGFVGLIVPHVLRIIIGARHRQLILMSFLFGGTLLLFSDGIAQTAREIPAGVITALTGAPIFCWLLVKNRS